MQYLPEADMLSLSEKEGTPKPWVPSALPTTPLICSLSWHSACGGSLLQKIFFSSWLQGCGPAISLIRSQLLNCK